VRLPVPAPVIPCALTVAGLAAGLLGASSLASGEVAVGVAWVAVGQCLDIADGRVARRMGAATEWGAHLDYCVDIAVTHALLAQAGAWGLMGAAALLQTCDRAGKSKIRASGRAAATGFAVLEAML
jgi:phosphatidylglycerophosphate synthase